MRLFIAIELPAEVEHQVALVSRRWQSAAEFRGTWVAEGNHHLTVVFLGEVPESKLWPLRAVLALAVVEQSSFQLSLDALEVIPRNRPRVLALSVSGVRPFLELQRAFKQAVAEHFTFKPQAKAPHLTLARFSQAPRTLPKIAVPPLSFIVDHVTLLQSTLRPQGPLYQPIQVLRLGAETAGRFRPNVVICVLNPKREVLLVWHREHVKGYWQFLQGGIDAGESTAEAVARELREELGLCDYTLLAVRERVYRYLWPKHLVRAGTDPDKQGYAGQEQSIAIVRVAEARPRLKPDAREAAATKWFALDTFMTALNPIRRSLGQLVMVELAQLGILSHEHKH